MATKTVHPTLGAESFNCPSCGALAHQNWFNLHGDQYKKDEKPVTIDPDAVANTMANREADAEIRIAVAEYFRKRLTQLPFF
jgi:hypothetical protein